MGNIRTKTKKLFFPAVFFLFTLFYISCSQTLPDIVRVDYSVIFEYKDEETAPSSRLSVMADSESDVRRYSAIRLVSNDSGFVWETGDILKIQETERQWAGNVNFIPPENQIIPSGLYELSFINADEEEDSISFTLAYDKKFYDSLSSDVPDLMKTLNGSHKIAIYDENGKMLYYGNRDAELQTVRGIWNNYREAKFFQDIWYSADKSVMCILPEEDVALE